MWIDRRGDGTVGRMYIGRERCHFFSVGAGDSVGPPGIMKAFLRGDSDEGGSPSLQPDQRARGARVRRPRRRAWRRWTRRASTPASCCRPPASASRPQLRETPGGALPERARLQSLARRGLGLRRATAASTARRCCRSSICDAGASPSWSACWRAARASSSSPPGRSPGARPADPYFDPFWARCEEAGINVVYHIGRTPFSEMYNPPWGLRPHPPSHRHSLMELALSFTERPIVDTHHRADRRQPLRTLPAPAHPQRRVRLELGGAAAAQARPHRAAVQQGHVALRHAAADAERHLPPERLGGAVLRGRHRRPGAPDRPGHVLNGSDYPHPEGLLWPIEFADELDGLSTADVRLIMRDNLAALL